MGKRRKPIIANFSQNLETELKTTQQKLDKLVSTYLDGDIEKEIYLEKKEELTKQKLSLLKQKEDFGQKRRNWVEPLREWMKLSSEAEINQKSQNYHELKQAVEKIGTNASSSTGKSKWIFPNRGDLPLCARRKAAMPSGEAARQSLCPQRKI